MRHSRVLVYGAGVIGTFYAELLATAGEDVSLLARGRRLEQLRSRKDITVLDRLDDGDRFDFILGKGGKKRNDGEAGGLFWSGNEGRKREIMGLCVRKPNRNRDRDRS